jgi:hypothetical protein
MLPGRLAGRIIKPPPTFRTITPAYGWLKYFEKNSMIGIIPEKMGVMEIVTAYFYCQHNSG